MPRKPASLADLSVAVPSSRAYFGGGVDNPDPAGPSPGGAMRQASAKRKARQSARRREAGFGGANRPIAQEALQAHVHAYASIAGQKSDEPDLPPAPGPPTLGLSGPMGGMGIADGPISTRTRLRRKWGFPLPEKGALAALETKKERDAAPLLDGLRARDAESRRMVSMSVAAAKQRGAADAEAAAAKAKARLTKASISRWMNLPAPDAAGASAAADDGPSGAAGAERAIGSKAERPASSPGRLASGASRKGRLSMLPGGGRRQRVECDTDEDDD